MRWLYKIWGGYDGFRPSEIPRRLLPGDELQLGWAPYADAAELGDEVWVWFFEGKRFTPGVYAKGIIQAIDPVEHELVLQTHEWNDTTPLTSDKDNQRLAQIVKPKNRQVFVLPDKFRQFGNCTAELPGASSCADRNCDDCTFWNSLPVIRPSHVRTPDVIAGRAADFAPAYWVVATRDFVWKQSHRQKPGIRKTTDMFNRFKTGEAALAYPLAKGMEQALAIRSRLDADAIVPIPLNPEKVKAGEMHRTLLLAQALRRRIKVPIIDGLRLTAPIGKRLALHRGQPMDEFRRNYTEHLEIDESVLKTATIILVDDVCTNGNTTAATIDGLRSLGFDGDVVVSTAGQMTIRNAVRNDSAILKPAA